MGGTIKFSDFSKKVLEGDNLSREEALQVARASSDEVLALLDAAFQVRRLYHGREVRVHILQNAESGTCPEDCVFCSQSVRFQTSVDRYPIQDPEKIIANGLKAHQSGAVTYCIVTATRGPSNRELDVLKEVVQGIKEETGLKICASLGLLSPQQAIELAGAGVDRYNHNLETSRRFFPEICTTHTYDDRLKTLEAVKTAGMEICSGGIIGMGETPEDWVDLAFALREVQADSIPVNFLDPRPGTPLAHRPRIQPYEALKALALFRLVHPDKDIRAAGGREVCLGYMQPLALFAANSIFTSGYLTTPGQEPSEDWKMIRDAGFEVAVSD